MDTVIGTRQVHPGAEIYGSDDNKIGKIVAADSHFMTVERGILSKTEFYIPLSAINSMLDDRVYLNVTKDEALHAGWDVTPTMTTDAGNPLSPGGI